MRSNTLGNIFPGYEVHFNSVAEGYDKMRPGYVPQLYRRDRTFTAEEYIRLISTYADHIALVDRQAECYALVG